MKFAVTRLQCWRLYMSGKVSNLSSGKLNYNQSSVKRTRDTPPSEYVTSCRVTYRDVRVPVSPSAQWWPPGWAASWRQRPCCWSTWTGTRWATSGQASGWNHRQHITKCQHTLDWNRVGSIRPSIRLKPQTTHSKMSTYTRLEPGGQHQAQYQAETRQHITKC